LRARIYNYFSMFKTSERILAGLCFFFFSATTSAQTKEIHVADYLPDVRLSHVFNYKHDTLRLSDFRGKAVILDFGRINCHGCLLALPKFDTLQELFRKDFQAIWVTDNSDSQIKQFLATDSIGKQVKIPIIAEDTVLDSTFLHMGIPYEVWVDQYGNVLSITTQRFVNYESLDFFIHYYMQPPKKKSDFYRTRTGYSTATVR